MIISLWHFLLQNIQLQTEMSEKILHRRQSLVKSVSFHIQPRYHRQQRECVLKSNLLRATQAPAAARHSHNSHCFLSHWQLSQASLVPVTQHCCCHCALSLARRLPLVLRSRLPTTSSAQQRRPDDPRQPGTAGAHNIIKCVFVYICICLFS